MWRRSEPGGAVRTAALACLAGILGACMVGPDFERPAAPRTDRYIGAAQPPATAAAGGAAQHFAVGDTVDAQWWALFGSAQLDDLMRTAFSGNPSLQSAQAALAASQDNLRAGYGVFFPQIGVSTGAVRERTSPYQAGARGGGSLFNLFTLGASISYVLDVFGGERRQVEALAAQVDVERNTLRAAYLSLSSNIVNTLIARAAYAREIEATRQLIALQTEQVAIARTQAQAGTVAYASVLSVQSQLATSEAALPLLAQKVDQADHLLATLLGKLPSDSSTAPLALGDLRLPDRLPLSLPSDLVRQRPDILVAEAQLHQASASIGVATAALFPSFSLSGSYGFANTKFPNLTDAAGRFWSVGPSVEIPLFQGGALWFKRKAAIDAYRQTAADYRSVVLGAFAQVADTLEALRHDAESLDAQNRALATAREALDLIQANYQAGLVGYLDVLNADAQYHQAQISQVQVAAQRYQDTTALFVALGGGWWNAEGKPGAGVATMEREP